MLDRRRKVLDDRVEEAVGAEVARRDPARDREHRAVVGALLERGDDLLVGDLLALEVALHQRVGRLGHLVHQLLAVLLRLVLHLVRDRDLAAVVLSGALVAVGLHVDEVDHAGDLVLGADRDLGGDHVRAEGRPEALERAEEVGALAVEHVDEDQAREVELGGALPQSRRVHLDAHHRVDDEHGRLADAQRAERVGDEAGVPGRVEQVDLAVLPFEDRERSRDRHLARLLVRIGVRHGRPLDHGPEPVDHTRLEQQRLVQRGLTTAPVADERHVANAIRGLVHALLLSLERRNVTLSS